VKPREEHDSKLADQQACAIKEQQKMTATLNSGFLQSDTDSTEDETGNSPFKRPCHNNKCKKTGTIAFIPPDILSCPKIVSLATRLKMTSMQQAATITNYRSRWQFFKSLICNRGPITAPGASDHQ
jgi:hypothetical protein